MTALVQVDFFGLTIATTATTHSYYSEHEKKWGEVKDAVRAILRKHEEELLNDRDSQKNR